MASASKINLEKERQDLVKANALLDDVHFERPTKFSNPPLNCCEISWLRPSVLTKDPDVYAFDTVKVTRIAICEAPPDFDWFMVPLANMCLYPNLIYNMLPATEDFSKTYGGMFKVRFHDSGKWIEIVIDDRLPHHTCTPPDWKLYIVSSPNGYWLPLIIKAYAKLHGSYDKLMNGDIYDAFSEFTSGVTETFDLKDPLPKFHIALKKYFDSACLMNTKYVYKKDDTEFVSHYAVVDIQCPVKKPSDLKVEEVTLKLQYLFSTPEGKPVTDQLPETSPPPGQSQYTDNLQRQAPHRRKSQSVRSSNMMKLLMQLNSRDNTEGAYSVTYNDFVQLFRTLYVCTMDWGVGVFVREPTVRWNSYKFNGAWSTTNSSSHSLYDPGSIPFWIYPQFKFELRELDSYRKDLRCEFLVSLQQPGHLYSPSIALIGYFIFKLVKENTVLPVGPQFFKMYRPVTSIVQHGRLIQTRLKMPIGAYLIIPVAEPENNNKFFLTVITEAKYSVWGYVPKRTKQLSMRSNASVVSETVPRRSAYSHLKRMSQDPSMTPSPSELGLKNKP